MRQPQQTTRCQISKKRLFMLHLEDTQQTSNRACSTFSLGFTQPTAFHLRFLRGASTKGKVTVYTLIPI